MTEKQPSILPLSDADLDVLRQLYQDVRVNTFHKMDRTKFNLQDFDDHTSGEAVLVARWDGVIAGFISIWEPEKFIHHLYVSSKHQRMGIGSQLVEKAIQVFGTPLQLKCLLKNKSAIEFYQHGGFKVKETVEDADGAYYLMELQEETH